MAGLSNSVCLRMHIARYAGFESRLHVCSNSNQFSMRADTEEGEQRIPAGDVRSGGSRPLCAIHRAGKYKVFIILIIIFFF